MTSPPHAPAAADPNPIERGVHDAVDFDLRSVELIDTMWRKELGLPRRPEGGLPDALRGRQFVEIGPGMDLGIGLCLCGLGVTVFEVDRYLCAWDAQLHPAIYTALARAALERWPGFDAAPLLECVRVAEHRHPGFQALSIFLEEARGIPDGSIDVTYSNATFEHIVDVDATAAALARVTRPGGLAFHQTDFRDHRSFDRPLEFLTLSEEAFLAMAREARWTCGNRVRPSEWLAAFHRHGFAARIDVNLRAEAAYAADVRRRCLLRFAALPFDEFDVLGGRFVARRA